MKKNPEILAPAGSEEQLIAAVRAGADAVYLAEGEFNARRNAQNFTGQALENAIAYCRERGVKVYIALNILITDTELPKLVSLAHRLVEAGVDGVILQDLAAAFFLHQLCPSLPLHASTQMTIHNRAGVRLLKELGFTRFIPARELSLKEISALANENDLETEVFVHGALCMSVSGKCYLSSLLGGRSGNRGLCAQICRLNFHANGREYALSLKDMSHLDHLQALAEAGVDSFKIEGRMKRPEYAAVAVGCCRQALAGEAYDKTILKNIFSRSGFTDGYLFGKRDLSNFGTRTKEDVVAASEKVFSEIQATYQKEKQRIPLSATLLLTKEQTRFTLSDGKNTVTILGEGGFLPNQTPLTKEKAKMSISKTGDTPYFIQEFAFQNDQNLLLSVANLNEIRRKAIAQLSEIRRKPGKRAVFPIAMPYLDLPEAGTGHGGFALRFAKAEQCFDGDFDRVFLPYDEIERHPELIHRYGEALCAETPSLLFAEDEERFIKTLEGLRSLGIHTATAENIGMLQLLKEARFQILGGMGLNILNSAALYVYQELGLSEATLSFELNLKSMAKLRSALPLTAVVYGHLPLMQYRCCPLQGKKGCGNCKGQGELIDRIGVHFPIQCEKRKFSVLYNSVPLDVCDRDFPEKIKKLLYFTGESKKDCEMIFQKAKQGKLTTEKHTTGLYFKKLL